MLFGHRDLSDFTLITHRLVQLKRQGVLIDRALDIGAYRGGFTDLLLAIWPGCRIQQFEADERQKPYIPNAKICLLGDSERDVNFYTLPEASCTAGSSVYRENSVYYKDPLVLAKRMVTLDSVADYSGDWSRGFVKIDTQGSELLILKGAKGLLAKRPRFMLLECSVCMYNIDAPLIDDVICQMREYGYRTRDVCNLLYLSQGELLQTDILFEAR